MCPFWQAAIPIAQAKGFTGSGKTYIGCALAKKACTHRIRAHYIRMPDLAEAWALARDKPNGTSTFLKKYAACTLLVLDEYLLDPPDEEMRSMLLELLKRRYGNASTVLCTQYAQKDWHQLNIRLTCVPPGQRAVQFRCSDRRCAVTWPAGPLLRLSAFIRRSTAQRATWWPARPISFHIFRAPCTR